MTRTFALIALVSSTLGGCLVEEPDPSGEGQIISDLYGNAPNGTSLTGIALGAATLDGVGALGTGAQGEVLTASSSGAAPLSGGALVGSTWTAQLSDGTALALRVDAAAHGAGPNADVWAYTISYQSGTTRAPLCGLDAAGTPIRAVAVPGTWNQKLGSPGGGAYDARASQFTLACRGSSIGKCVEMGYKPWQGYADQLGACVRALRADYCGDGTAYTVSGTLVDLYDRDGVQSDDAAWVPEAEWTPDGARCISALDRTRAWQRLGARPWCFPSTLPARTSCGTGFGAGPLLITELAAR